MIEVLIECGAELGAKDHVSKVVVRATLSCRALTAPCTLPMQLGATPLHEAVCKGHEAVAELLLNRGAEVDARNIVSVRAIFGR